MRPTRQPFPQSTYQQLCALAPVPPVRTRDPGLAAGLKLGDYKDHDDLITNSAVDAKRSEIRKLRAQVQRASRARREVEEALSACLAAQALLARQPAKLNKFAQAY